MVQVVLAVFINMSWHLQTIGCLMIFTGNQYAKMIPICKKLILQKPYFYYAILCYIILYYIILYYVILYYIILHCIVLYCIILYCII